MAAALSAHSPSYLNDLLTRLSTQKASTLADLLPHNWTPADKA